jgi:hypothetical protein
MGFDPALAADDYKRNLLYRYKRILRLADLDLLVHGGHDFKEAQYLLAHISSAVLGHRLTLKSRPSHL